MPLITPIDPLKPHFKSPPEGLDGIDAGTTFVGRDGTRDVPSGNRKI